MGRLLATLCAPPTPPASGRRVAFRMPRSHPLSMRHLYIALGALSVALGVVGIFLPLLPTVPFMLLAAYFFAKGHPPFEQRLLDDPRFGPHIRAWRTRGAITRRAKLFAALRRLETEPDLLGASAHLLLVGHA